MPKFSITVRHTFYKDQTFELEAESLDVAKDAALNHIDTDYNNVIHDASEVEEAYQLD